MKRGRLFEPGNKFGRGRPPGSRNKRTLMAQKLLDTHSEGLVRKSILGAIQGDRQLLKTLIPYALPRRKDLPVKLGSLRINTIAELDQSSKTIFDKVSAGLLTLAEGLAVAELIESRRRVIQTCDLDARLRAMERERDAGTESSSAPAVAELPLTEHDSNKKKYRAQKTNKS